MEDSEKIRKAADKMVAFGGIQEGIYKALYNNKELMQGLERMKSHQMDMGTALVNALKGMNLNQFQQISTTFQGIAPTIPISTLEAIRGIGVHYEGIFSQWRDLGLNLQKTFTPSHLERLQKGFQGLGLQSVALSIAAKDWQTIENIENIVSETAEISGKIIQNDYATTQDIKRLETLILQVINLLPQVKNKSVLTILIYFFSCFFNVLGHSWTLGEIYLAYRDEPKPLGEQSATKQDVENLKRELIEVLRIEGKLLRVTNWNCKVHSSPKNKSKVIESLPSDVSVLVIGKKGKWAHINFTSLKDGLPDTGWCLKKHLSPTRW
jgi:hypothetical protein